MLRSKNTRYCDLILHTAFQHLVKFMRLNPWRGLSYTGEDSETRARLKVKDRCERLLAYWTKTRYAQINICKRLEAQILREQNRPLTKRLPTRIKTLEKRLVIHRRKLDNMDQAALCELVAMRRDLWYWEAQ